ncbi:UNVERIFIED_CONTAM: hypothetical protein HDU68_003863 [Siphonaria sp. JEL0065]|nr:hypothetical protein HDU68_003863 [Siphonaria sp. JEL0065]
MFSSTSETKLDFTDIPLELVFQIFAWIHPTKVFTYRILSKQIKSILESPHFAILLLKLVEKSNTEVSTSPSFNSYRSVTNIEHVFLLSPPSFQVVYARHCLAQATAINWTSRFSTTNGHYVLPTGAFPLLGENLQQLRITRLHGQIPPEIGLLFSLQNLNLDYNSNLAGEIPPEIGNLRNLVSLSLGSCGLSGKLPDEIGELVKLQRLYIPNNKLCGPIPAAIGKLKMLQHLYLGMNQFSGDIPKEIGQLKCLENLALHGNQLSGKIPDEIGDLGILYMLNLSRNMLTGLVPLGIQECRNLRVCNLTNNAGLTCLFQMAVMQL